MSTLKVRNIKVRSLSVEFNEISWELEPTLEDVLDYTFQVLRSEGAEGPFDELSDQFTDQYIFVDNALKAFNRYRQYFYNVRVRNKSTDEYEDFGPASAGQDADLVAKELRSHIQLLMREFIGERCWILPVRTFGARCPGCWSESLKKRTRSGCRTCWDTSFIRGYMHPIESWISFDPSPKNDQPTNLGKLQQNNTTARLAHFPPIKPRDLIIGSTNERWKVVQVSSTRHVGTVVHQELQLHEVPHSAIEYAIPLQLEGALRDLFLKPERNFTNPQNLDAQGVEPSDGVFSLYHAGKET